MYIRFTKDFPLTLLIGDYCFPFCIPKFYTKKTKKDY